MPGSDEGVWKILIPLFTTFLGLVVGWILKGNESYDKELADRIDDIVKEMSEIEKLAIDLWKDVPVDMKYGTELDQSKTNTIEAKLHRIADLLEDINDRIPQFEGYRTPATLIRLRMACTSDGSGVEDFPLPPGPLRIKTVIMQCTELLRSLRKMRQEVLPRQSFRRLIRQARLPDNSQRRHYWDE